MSKCQKAYLIEPRGGADLVLAESLPPEHLLPRGAVIAFRSYHYCLWTVIFGDHHSWIAAFRAAARDIYRNVICCHKKYPLVSAGPIG